MENANVAYGNTMEDALNGELKMAEYFAGGHLRYVNGEWRDDDGNVVEIARIRNGVLAEHGNSVPVEDLIRLRDHIYQEDEISLSGLRKLNMLIRKYEVSQ